MAQPAGQPPQNAAPSVVPPAQPVAYPVPGQAADDTVSAPSPVPGNAAAPTAIGISDLFAGLSEPKPIRIQDDGFDGIRLPPGYTFRTSDGTPVTVQGPDTGVPGKDGGYDVPGDMDTQ